MMKGTGITRCCALVILCLGGVLASGCTVHRMTEPAEPLSVRPAYLDDVVAARLQALYDELLERKGVHQAVVIIETGDGSQRWIGAAGEGRAEPSIDADTPVVLASITKLYTAALVLRLVERGRFKLDQPIVSLLPDSLTQGLHRLGRVDHTADITVRHLLAHTSGLADYFTDRPRGGKSLSGQLAESDLAWTAGQMIERVRTELVPHFPPQPAHARKPKVRYSDTNYLLLRLIVEETEGSPLIEVMQRELLEPLGLRRTTAYPLTDAARDEPAPLWIGDARWELPQALDSFGADGAMIAPLSEAVAFMRALVHGRLFDDPATYDLMHDRWHHFGLPLDRAAIELPNWPIGYGLGMMRFQMPTILNGFRRMPVVLGHTGSTGAWLFYSPELDLFLAGTINQATGGALPYRFVPKLLQAFSMNQMTLQ